MTDLISEEDLVARWSGMSELGKGPAPREPYNLYVPLSAAAHEYVAEAQDNRRIYTGIPEFDYQTRGIGSGHLCKIDGYSHSGKTLFLMKILKENRTKRIAYWAPDETRVLILAKLTSIMSGVSARDLEDRVARGDQEAIDLLRHTAEVDFPNLAVFQGHLTPTMLERSYDELVQDVWQADCDLGIVDYVDLLDHGETPMQKFNYLKPFGVNRNMPLICIHQTSRSAGSDGQEMSLSSGNSYGEQVATFQFGVWRKKAGIRAAIKHEQSKKDPDEFKIQALEQELDIHQYTLTVNLNKNKRPGGQTVENEDAIDFEIEGGTGQLIQLGDRLPHQYRDRRQATSNGAAWEEQEIDYEYPN